MKTNKYRLVASSLMLMLFTGCYQNGNKEIRLAVEQQLQFYPESTLQDIYKSFFQDEYGPGHLLNDTNAARNYFDYELSQMISSGNYRVEPCGTGKNFFRVPLGLVKDGIVPAEDYFDAFMASAGAFREPGIMDWKKEWDRIFRAIEGMNPDIENFEADKMMLENMLEEGRFVVHHSRAYIENYDPHYRIIKKQIWEEVRFRLSLDEKIIDNQFR
ncbi:MAG: hypothetical protein K0B08_06410 [Bacteroidales bacterium]|nr:hypothetical protein [Bacteroidales bacterium]